MRDGGPALFLARREGRVVGRISAQIDHAFNSYQGNDWGEFGFLEAEQDQEVFDALLDAASAWLRTAPSSPIAPRWAPGQAIVSSGSWVLPPSIAWAPRP